MRIDIITAFPPILEEPLQTSIPYQAVKKGVAEYHIHNLRDFTMDKHRQIDDTPYGGGPGMILKPEPIFRAVDVIREQCTETQECEIIFPTPQGEPYTQDLAEGLSRNEHLIFICGHYKGVDERVREQLVTRELSELLDGPHYTRPEVFRGLKVPDILLSGHHEKIAAWRKAQRLERTKNRRDDLLIDHSE